MSSEAPRLLAALAAAGILGASFAYSSAGHAFDFGNMMNPSKWMGGGRDRHYDYEDGPYRGGPWGGPYGGGPWGGPGPYGAGPFGAGPYAAPGAYGAPGYQAAPASPPAAPAAARPSSTKAPAANSGEIDELKRRIEELESNQKPMPPPSDWGSAPTSPSPKPAADWRSPPSSSSSSSSEWGSAPAFRPLDRN